MQKKIIIITILLSSALFSFGQFPNWENWISTETYADWGLGQINETDKSIIYAKGKALHEMSYYGETIGKTVLNFDFPSSILASINTISKRVINNEEVYVTSVIRGPLLYFILFSLEGEQLATPFEIDDAIVKGDHKINTNVFEKQNGEFDVFTPNAFLTVRLNNDYTWEIINTVEHLFSDINNVKKAGNNYIITTSTNGNSKTALVSVNFTILWEVTIPIPITLIVGSQIANGYVVAGYDEWQGATHVFKISNDGDIEWDENYENTFVNDIIPWEQKVLLAGSKVFTIDAVGNTLWEKALPENIKSSDRVYRIEKSQLGGIIMRGFDKVYLLNINSQAPFNEYQTLAANNIGSHISPWGNIGLEGRDFTYPVNEATSTIFTSAPVFTGQTESGTLKGFYDFYAMGDEITGVITTTPVTWKIFQSEIDIVQQKLAAGIDLAPYSQGLLTYPAKGNPNCIIDGETITIDDDLAPFVDVNEDGIYNMFDGDYPEMKGDQMIWWAIKNPNSEMEIHGKWYAYQCGDHVISNTVYVDYKLINNSVDNLPICHFGKFTDFDLGCYTDDYMGSLPDFNSIFSYNQDSLDGTLPGFIDCDGGIYSYGNEIPIQSVTFLAEEMASAMYYNNGSIGAVSPATTDPSTFEEVFNYLQGKFRDGTPLTNGGTGYNPASTNTTPFAFPGNPSASDEWSMASEDLGVGDRRMIAGSNAFSLNAGDSKTFTFAYTTHPNIPHPTPDITPVVENIQQVTDIHDNGNAFAQVFLGQDQVIATGETITLNAGDNELEYVWSTDEDGASIQVSAPGTYAVTVIDETGCQRSDEIIINQATGIANVEVTQLAVYPNPAKSGASISIELPAMEEISMVKLFNIVGQEVYSENLMIQTQQVDVKLSDAFSSGIYVVQLTSVEGKILVGKVVIE